MFYTYVLQSRKNGKSYVGSCADLEERLSRHDSGRVKSTKSGIPWEVVHFERFESRSEAMAREKFYKTGKGRQEIKQYLDV
ncbi:MAG: GIY-YIG nuclease family protein [Verrucomicrobiota bacterium]